MSVVHLPAHPRWHRSVHGIIALIALFVMLMPITWGPRFATAIAVSAIGVSSWWHYRRRTPSALRLDADRHLQVSAAGTEWLSVVSLQLGVIRPWLVTAILVDERGGRRPLFVPGKVLGETQHWELRRMLIAARAIGVVPEGPGRESA